MALARPSIGAALAFSVLATACAGTGGSASATPTATRTPRPTVHATPTSPPVTFRSPLYPYSLALPPGATRGEWHPATERWDGVASVSHGAAMTDYVPIDDGDLFAYGTPWTKDLQSFGEVVLDNGAKYHGCSRPQTAKNLTLPGAPALLYTMTCSGQPVARVVLVKDRFGLVVAQLYTGGSASVDRLVVRLAALTWTPH